MLENNTLLNRFPFRLDISKHNTGCGREMGDYETVINSNTIKYYLKVYN